MSTLLADEYVTTQLIAQIDAVLDSVYTALGLAALRTDDSLSEQIGQDRARAGVHPTVSLRAANLIFEAALPTLTIQVRRAGWGTPALAAGLALNRAIMGRISVAAQSYVTYLLSKTHSSNHAERRHVSRQLHDVIAPPLVDALQNLDLHSLYRDQHPAAAAEKLDAVRDALESCISAVRDLAIQVRQSVGKEGLEHALRTVLARAPAHTRTRLITYGNPDRLPPVHREECFLIAQEALRNAFSHAHADQVIVTVNIADELRMTIRDDGRGFTTAVAPTSQSLGLLSMRERADLLNGNLTVDSAPGAGTTVCATIPLPLFSTNALPDTNRTPNT